MKREVGLWIDHQKAVMVTLTPDGETIRVVQSRYESPHPTGGSRTKAHQGHTEMTAEDCTQRQAERHIQAFYDEVATCLGKPDSLYIFGPGEARTEFRKRLERHLLGMKVVAVEKADRMTETQIVARVRAFYTQA